MRAALIFVVVVVSGCLSDPVGEETDINSETNSGNADAGCVAVEETCDGEDNDCDGEVDEDFATLGDDCNVGVGACESSGTIVCADDGATQCSAMPGSPGDELCGDDEDNDCDGEVDEGFDDLGMSCSAGVGVCAVDGEQVCDDEMMSTVCDATADEPAETPDETTCDGLDNDCDGEVDEGCDTDEDGWCAVGFTAVDGGPCTEGEDDCDDEDDTVYPGAPGKCDGKDTNCDGDVDNLLALDGSWQFDIDGDPLVGAGTSPILAAASDSGFCISFTADDSPGRLHVRAHANSQGQTLSQNSFGVPDGARLSDLTWGGGSCLGAYVVDTGTSNWDAYLDRYGPVSGGRAEQALNDEVGHIQGSWDLALVVIGNEIVLTYPPTSGNQAHYVTAPTNFGAGDVSAPVDDAGLFGSHPEAVASPTVRDVLYLSNFFNVNASHFDVGGSPADLSGLTLSGSASREEMIAQNVDGTTFLAIHHLADDRLELRAITSNGAYGSTGNTPAYTNPSGQEFINRELFASGLRGDVMFADPVDDRLYAVSDDGTDLTLEPVADRVGDLLAVRKVDDQTLQAVWMLDPGTIGSAADDASFEIVDYTCH